jgi:CubicO group peptidase (beta-lactamase class C family)
MSSRAPMLVRATVALAAFAMCAPPGKAQAALPLAAAVDRAAAEFIAKQHVPGVAIAVVEHGAIVYEHGYGYADVGDRVPVTVDTRFEIGSVSKQFTAACILQQVRAGTLSLDDPLGKFIPEYPAGAAVTVRQMLAHTSGLPEYAYYGDAANPSTLAAIIERVAKKPLNFARGARWSYSNTNYILLGRILELTAHQPYEQYVREHIFEPAHMDQSGFVSEERTLPGMSVGYDKSGPVRTAVVPRDAAGADGSIVSTVGDMAKWNRALASGTILAAADVRLMQTPVTLNDGSATKYGFGVAVDTFGGHPRVSHDGQSDGFAAENALFPHDDEAIVVLDNLAQSAPSRVTSAIFSAAHPDVTAKFNTAVPGEDKAVTARLRAVLRGAAAGQPDRTQFSRRFRAGVLDAGGTEFAKDELAPLGAPTRFIFRGKREQRANPSTSIPAMTIYRYNVAFGSDEESVVIGIDADDKIASFSFGRYNDSDAPAKLDTTAKEDSVVTARLRAWLRRVASGDIDRSQLADSFSSFYTPASAAQDQKEFGPLGAPQTVTFRGQTEPNATTVYTYDVTFSKALVRVQIAFDAQGRVTTFGYGRIASPKPQYHPSASRVK